MSEKKSFGEIIHRKTTFTGQMVTPLIDTSTSLSLNDLELVGYTTT